MNFIMILFNGAYYANSEIDIPNNQIPLLVTSAGHHILKTLYHFDTVRPNGRRDWQLLYIKHGCIHYKNDGKDNIAPQGSLLFYHPHVPQFYKYFLDDSADIYWVHFTGSLVAERLGELNLLNEMCYTAKIDKRYERLFDNIISELTAKKMHFSDICINILSELLCLFSRNIISDKCSTDGALHEIDNIIHQLNTDFSRHFNIDELAQQHNLSVSWMMRLFNKRLNMSPQKYLTQIRVEKAKTMMIHTNNSISDIAAAVGYSDPLYFSRIFRKTTGIPPTEYRQKSAELNTITLDNAPWNESTQGNRER